MNVNLGEPRFKIQSQYIYGGDLTISFHLSHKSSLKCKCKFHSWHNHVSLSPLSMKISGTQTSIKRILSYLFFAYLAQVEL